MRLYVIANATERTGRGRAMRCYAVAQAWRRLVPEGVVSWNGVVTFPDVAAKVKKVTEEPARCFHGWLLLDDGSWPSKFVGGDRKIAVFDDLGMAPMGGADLVINYAPYAHMLKYSQTALIGPEYTPIRDELRKDYPKSEIPWPALKTCGSGLTALESAYQCREVGEYTCLANDQVAQCLWLRLNGPPEVGGDGADRIVKAMLAIGGNDVDGNCVGSDSCNP